MHCPSCNKLIERATQTLKGVQSVSARYATQRVEVTYDDDITDQSEIFELIDSKGYHCTQLTPLSASRKILRILSGLLGIGLILFAGTQLMQRMDFPELSAGMSYGVLFLVGLS